VKIRAARPSDKRHVREFLARLWSDDYILDVFDDWVRDRRGRLWVAVEDDRVVAIAKLTLLGDREAWLHALRVDPRYHRRGIGGALFAHRVARARRLGARVARFDTVRLAMRKIARRHGFQVRDRYRFFGLKARRGVAPRLARRGELAQLWRLIAQGDGLFHDSYTRRALTRADIGRAIRERGCVVAEANGRPAAFAILHPEKDRLGLSHVAGSGRALVALLGSLAAEATRLGKPRVTIAASHRHWRAVRAAGYRSRWDETEDVFEGRL